MRRSPRVGFTFGLAVAVFAALSIAGCGGKPHGADTHGGAKTTAPPPPTPDTTPIEALRTPAGLVLKIDGAATPATPSPTPSAATPTPSAPK